jgi:hypothetical protein
MRLGDPELVGEVAHCLWILGAAAADVEGR